MDSVVNRRIVLASRPCGVPALSDFDLVEEPVDPPEPGRVTVAVDVLSIDAFIRTVLDERSYHGSVDIGSTIVALGIGHVLASSVDNYRPGDAVFGPLGAQTVSTSPPTPCTISTSAGCRPSVTSAHSASRRDLPPTSA